MHVNEEEEPAKLQWVEGLKFVGSDGYGHSTVLDSYIDKPGEGIPPSRLLLIALGGCTGMDFTAILRKRRQEFTNIKILVDGDNAAEHPKYFTNIKIKYIVRGKNLSEDEVKHAIQLSMERYCIVASTVNGKAKIETSYEIVNEN